LLLCSLKWVARLRERERQRTNANERRAGGGLPPPLWCIRIDEEGHFGSQDAQVRGCVHK
jgi:hypothetical protein